MATSEQMQEREVSIRKAVRYAVSQVSAERVKYLLARARTHLAANAVSVLDLGLYQYARELRDALDGVTVFEPRTARFEGPLGGEWLRREKVATCPKELPWSEWSNGGTKPEPECPCLVLVDPLTGAGNLTFITTDDDGSISNRDLTRVKSELLRCLNSWIRFVDSEQRR